MLTESFSGIRGLYKEDLTKEVIKGYSLAFSEFLKKAKKKPVVVIGMDTRPSSSTIKEEMKNIFISEGIGVIDVGFNTTPAIQHGVREFKADGGVIISASHNEPEWNGWKLLSNKGSVLSQKDIKGIIEKRKAAKPSSSKEKGNVVDRGRELRESYIRFVLDSIGKDGLESIKKAKLKVVVDPNGGAATVTIKDLFEKIGITAIYKNMDLGVFNRIIEPNEKSLAYLAFYVEDLNADLGAGWDCDGDRVEIVLPNDSEFTKTNGRMLSGQYILALIVEEILSEYKGKNKIVVTNDATSNLVSEVAAKHGAKVVEVEVGEINVVEKMEELNAPVGGEGSSSGGIIPPSRCRDGIISLMFILKLMAKKGKRLNQILEKFPSYFNSRSDLRCEPKKAVLLRKKIEQYWKKQKYIQEIRKTGDETGGLKIVREPTKEGPGWIWYRASKTESGVFRIITDAKNKLYADKLLAMGEKAFDDCLSELR